MNPWHFDGCHAAFASLRNPCGIGNEDDFATPRLHFLHIRNGFLKQRAGRRDNDHWNRIVDQGDGAVLHLPRSEEHTSELQSLMRISYAVFCLKKKKKHRNPTRNIRYPTIHTHSRTSDNQYTLD